MACDIRLIFEGVKTVFDPIAQASWPIALAWGLWFFRADIRAVLPRLRSIKGVGIEAELQSETQQATSIAESENSQLKAGFGTELPPPDIVLSAMDDEARELLEREVVGDDPKKLLAWAIRLRSISEEYRIHETNYRLIFGSQLKALQRLHLVVKAPLIMFYPFFQEAQNSPETAAIHTERNFGQWATFLVNIGYVKLITDVDPNEAEITPLGQRFLIWMTANRIPDFRPG